MKLSFKNFLLLFVFLLSVECAFDKSHFTHNGKRYTIIGASETTRSKRETSTSNTTPINECYQFTAIGGFSNETGFEGSEEATCEKFDKYSPCFLPFIFVEDGSMPSPSAAYDYCKKFGCKITCSKSSHTCIRYSHLINGVTSNITYFCGDVQDTTDDVVLKTGQVTDTLPGGIVREVTFCQSPLCNSSPSDQISLVTSFFLLSVALLLK